MNYYKFFQNQYFKNLSFILLFLVFSFTIGVFKKSSLEPIQDIKNINFLSNKEKLFEGHLPTVLYVWATWCTVCNANSYIINWNYKIANFFNVQFISLEEGENLDLLNIYLKERSISYPIGILNEHLSVSLKISEYPTFIFLDKENRVKLKDSGIVNPISFFIRLIYIKYF
jgi:thiol-disulfide isomerase/thioredoxin